ncbi:palmitoyltransferase for Vac8p [Tulasnella sp. 331]|nr:palmitoyltransferase for Vac8p [Tulasnella sp. 331]
MSTTRPKPKPPLLSFELKSQPTLGSGASIDDASRLPRATSPRLDSSPAGYPDWGTASGSAELSSVRSSPGKKKHWTAYIPTLFTLLLLLVPHISLFKVLFHFYLIGDFGSPAKFLFHLGATYTLSFISLTCFLVVIVRDPGPVDGVKAQRVEDAWNGYGGGGVGDHDDDDVEEEEDEEVGESISLTDALMKREVKGNGKPNGKWNGNRTGERRWCQKLETDSTPYHTLFLALIGLCFGLSIGGFWAWHMYLISTNQTTLESLTSYLLLGHIPPPSSQLKQDSSSLPERRSSTSESSGASFITPKSPSQSSQQDTPPSTPPPRLSPTPALHDPDSPFYFPSPPAAQLTRIDSADSALLNNNPVVRLQEHQLTGAQRRRVRYAASKIRLYDLGSVWKNWSAVALGGRGGKGGRSWRWWMWLVFCGGRGEGDGYSFEFNPKAERQLQRLADQLAEMQ